MFHPDKKNLSVRGSKKMISEVRLYRSELGMPPANGKETPQP